MLELETNNRKQTDTYNVKSDIYNGFMLDIVTTYNNHKTPSYFEAYLYHNTNSIKEELFGISADDNTTDYEEFLSIVTGCLEQYIPDYIKEYCID